MIKICFLAEFYPGPLLMTVPLLWTTAHYCHRTEIVLKNQNKQIGFSVETIYPFQEAFSDRTSEVGTKTPKSSPSSIYSLLKTKCWIPSLLHNMTNIKRHFLVKAELVASLRLLYWGPPDPPLGPPTMLLDPICLTIDQPPKFRQPVWWAQLCLFFLSSVQTREDIFRKRHVFSFSHKDTL